MAYNIKITPPYYEKVKKKKTSNQRYGRGSAFFVRGHSGPDDKPGLQSPVRQWADMDEAERQAIRDRLDVRK